MDSDSEEFKYSDACKKEVTGIDDEVIRGQSMN